METIEELSFFLTGALDEAAKNRVVDTGEAWSIMRENGITRPDAPPIRQLIECDMTEYGFAVLDAALELRRLDKSHELLRPAFRKVGRVFESVVRNGDPGDARRGFHRVIAACAYHLGGYAAIAYALFKPVDVGEQNLNMAELSLVYLFLRDLNGMVRLTEECLLASENQDPAITTVLQSEDEDRYDSISRILITGVCRALANYEYALRTGDQQFMEAADVILSAAHKIAEEQAFITLWWIIRLVQHLLNDLWPHTLHVVIPLAPKSGDNLFYSEYRSTYIASLFTLSTSQVELWPSQLDAAQRASDPEDDLVVALPTSAGKTRIAELAALTTLSAGQRVLIVTPLRALSAQTERSFRKAFSPIGASVSSLYGVSGLSAGDADALYNSQIVVATPEKLDFALRSDPDVIADVGLIILDEGHLIGPSEREIRYEMLVQRLLRRTDADGRRLICLSAILPDGSQLEDMTNWIRSDVPGDAIRSEWRPTRQRFGTLEWRGQVGRLNYDLEDAGPFVSSFIEELPALGRDRRSYPRTIQDMTLIAAWKFAEQGKRSLIYITQANWVDGYGEQACNLVRRGYLPSLLEDEEAIQTALTIGTEWLGADHPAVACLKIGVAVHHGRLPSPFLREIERLLAAGKIKVTAASPTLAQGLNLNAAVLLVPYLVREGAQISGEEFANVAGRAGRAFVDTEGLILHVMIDKFARRRRDWKQLVVDVKKRSLHSGLTTVIDQVVKRLAKRGIGNNEQAYEFLVNAREPWLEEPVDPEGEPLADLISRLDLIVFGLVEALDSDAEDLPELLENALQGSLWMRQIERLDPGIKQMQMIVLRARARLIWNSTTPEQRKGHFAMGVGLDTGLVIDDMADELAECIDQADLAAQQGDIETLHKNLCDIGERMMAIKPFIPKENKMLTNEWQAVLLGWLSGDPVAVIGPDNIGMVEDAFVYRLVWALETIRTRRQASGWEPQEGVIAGAAAACLDTGLPKYQMSMLVRSGLSSRQAAKTVLEEIDPWFFDSTDLRAWLRSDEVSVATARENWPSSQTVTLWRRYRNEMLAGRERAWRRREENYTLPLDFDLTNIPGLFGRIQYNENDRQYWITSVDFEKICPMPADFFVTEHELVYVNFSPGTHDLKVIRRGPDHS